MLTKALLHLNVLGLDGCVEVTSDKEIHAGYSESGVLNVREKGMMLPGKALGQSNQTKHQTCYPFHLCYRSSHGQQLIKICIMLFSLYFLFFLWLRHCKAD